jgi:hypothetical protein
MFQRCLISTDFADGLYRLVHCVPSFASGGLQRLVFLHSVWEEGKVTKVDEDKLAQAKDKLSRAWQTIPQGIEVQV